MKLKKALTLSLPLLLLRTQTVFASLAWQDPTGENPAQLKDLEVIIERLIILVTGLIGFAFVAALVIGGFKYMTAGDDPKAAQAAKQTLTYAFIGLLLFFSALLVTTLIEGLTGINLSVFNIDLSEL